MFLQTQNIATSQQVSNASNSNVLVNTTRALQAYNPVVTSNLVNTGSRSQSFNQSFSQNIKEYSKNPDSFIYYFLFSLVILMSIILLSVKG